MVVLEVRFQFHIGSIQRAINVGRNATVVMFQFHIGSIQSHVRPVDPRRQLMFQFHIGSIQSSRPAASDRERHASFNSTLVRFKVYPVATSIALRSSFNSTLVRFKVPGWSHSLFAPTAFQFHIGSIQRSRCSRRSTATSTVSIPHWFDSKSQSAIQAWEKEKV